MSKLANLSSNQTLREYAQGAAQSATSAVADFLAPTVPVATPVGHYKRYDQKHRFRVPDTRRTLGGKATVLDFGLTDETYNCSPHALDLPMDHLELIDDIVPVFQEGADMLADVAALAHEKHVIDTALASVGAGTALSIGPNDDIVDQLDGDILSVIKAARYGALMGVGILIGAGAWRKIRNHASVKGRIVAGNKKTYSTLDIGDFGELLLGTPQSRVALMVADDNAEGLAGDIGFLLDGDVLIFARRDQPTRLDPSFMKTFRLRDQWMVPGSYTREDGRVEVAKFDWSEDVKVVNSGAAIRRTVSL